MPPKTQRAWSADEIGFAIRDWLVSFGRLPRLEDWRPNALPPTLRRYGALRDDGLARWPSAKSVMRRFSSWEHAYSHALTGADVLVLARDRDATQVNVDEAAKVMIGCAMTIRVRSVIRSALGEQTVDEVIGLLVPAFREAWNEPARAYVPPPLDRHRPRLR